MKMEKYKFRVYLRAISAFFCVYFFSILPFSLNAFSDGEKENASATPFSEDQSVQHQLQELQKEQKESRKRALNEELQAQTYFRNNPKAYLEKVQQEENDEKHLIELQEKIDNLQKPS